MGTLAGNERRGSDDWPARSAVTGMLGAGLGVDRGDQASLASLEDDYAIGLSRLRLGPMLTDFHTVQTVSTAAAKRPSSRREALAIGKAKGSLGTLITHREYHEECVFDVALSVIAEQPRWSLEELRDALLRPQYTLYFGRKACSLDLPTGPRVVESADTLEALEAYRQSMVPPSLGRTGEYLLDERLVGSAVATARTVVRRDGVMDRKRWIFSERRSVLVNLTEGEKP